MSSWDYVRVIFVYYLSVIKCLLNVYLLNITPILSVVCDPFRFLRTSYFYFPFINLILFRFLLVFLLLM